MRTITKPQLTAIHTMLSKHKMIDPDIKKGMVKAYTCGRTESSREMYLQEAEELIKYLKTLDPSVKAADKMRKKIISIAHDMNWKLENGKADMKRVNGWCEKFGHGKKRLDDYKYEELPALVSQFQTVYKDFIKK